MTKITMNYSKRKFLKNGLLSAMGLSVLNSGPGWAAVEANAYQDAFTLRFSPEFGIFSALSGNDPVDQIQWGNDNGFRAWENNYKNVLHHIAKKGYKGFLGLEHGIKGKGIEGTKSTLQQYRELDQYVRDRL